MQQVAVLGDGVTAKAVKAALPSLGLQYSSLETADIVVSSPGIPPEQYPDTPLEIVSEIEFAFRLFKSRNELPTIVGVTGTNGKTTVTELISHICEIPSAGNIGEPLISYVGKLGENDAVVVELSSYQLEGCSTFSPDVAVLLNITEDHMARHKTMSKYLEAKSKVFAMQSQDDIVIYNAEDTLLVEACKKAPSKQRPFSTTHHYVDMVDNEALIGDHNLQNAVVALMVAEALGRDMDECAEKLKSFRLSAHRLEKVAVADGVTYYNDSKATNPDAVLKAMSAFRGKRVHLILSGEDKQVRLDAFLEDVCQAAETVCVFGGISALVKEWADSENVAIQVLSTMDDAIDYTMSVAQRGDIVLFSPSSASFDLYTSYQERGNTFKQSVLGAIS
jgi:UDP-N-acetylmuramoylalanine--D-glutamate ligase